MSEETLTRLGADEAVEAVRNGEDGTQRLWKVAVGSVRARVQRLLRVWTLEGKRPQERSLDGGSPLHWAGDGEAGQMRREL